MAALSFANAWVPASDFDCRLLELAESVGTKSLIGLSSAVDGHSFVLMTIA
jgi:hypothetical protein